MVKSLHILYLLLIGIANLFGQTREELLVKFSEIDSLQYMAFKKDYHSEREFDSSKISMYDSSFTLTINNEKERFEGDTQAEEWYIYDGFLPSLNSFVIIQCGSGYCGTILIDRETEKIQPIITPYEEAPCNTEILLSKDKNKILVLTSNAFDRESYIAIYQRESTTKGFDFSRYRSLTTDMWKVDEGIWVNNETFALLTYSEDIGCKTEGVPVKIKYLKVEINIIANGKETMPQTEDHAPGATPTGY